MPFIGEGTVAYNYVRTRFEWEYEEYSEYSSITNAISIVGQANKKGDGGIYVGSVMKGYVL